MAASASDKITDVRNAARPNSARATGTRSAGGTSLACDNLSGWPTASKVHFVTYQLNSSSAQVAGTQLDCEGIVSGNTIGSIVVNDGTDTGNSVNDVVEMIPTAKWAQDLADALTAQHTRTGGHTGITTDTLVVSSGTTLPAGDIGTADLADATITPAKLSAGTGTTWPWQSYVPVWVGTTIGNATVTALYRQTGKTVDFRIAVTAGSTTSLPVGTDTTFTLPVTALSSGYLTSVSIIGRAASLHSGTAQLGAVAYNSTTTALLLAEKIVSATNVEASWDTANVGLSAGDTWGITGTYEAA